MIRASWRDGVGDDQKNLLRDTLTRARFDKYNEYEKTIVEQAEMGVRMMASMLQQKPGMKAPAGK